MSKYAQQKAEMVKVGAPIVFTVSGQIMDAVEQLWLTADRMLDFTAARSLLHEGDAESAAASDLFECVADLRGLFGEVDR